MLFVYYLSVYLHVINATNTKHTYYLNELKWKQLQS